MKQLLLEKHKELTRIGYHYAARLILTSLISRGNITVYDHHDEAHNSGLVKWLMDNCNWYNGRYSFTAKINLN